MSNPEKLPAGKESLAPFYQPGAIFDENFRYSLEVKKQSLSRQSLISIIGENFGSVDSTTIDDSKYTGWIEIPPSSQKSRAADQRTGTEGLWPFKIGEAVFRYDGSAAVIESHGWRDATAFTMLSLVELCALDIHLNKVGQEKPIPNRETWKTYQKSLKTEAKKMADQMMLHWYFAAVNIVRRSFDLPVWKKRRLTWKKLKICLCVHKNSRCPYQI